MKRKVERLLGLRAKNFLGLRRKVEERNLARRRFIPFIKKRKRNKNRTRQSRRRITRKKLYLSHISKFGKKSN